MLSLKTMKNLKNSTAQAVEYNFDGLAGPTHNYAGLSIDNKASMKNKQTSSSPLKAALEGLEKMNQLMNLGFKQGIFPPHEKPDLPFFKHLGFSGLDAQILRSVERFSPALLLAGCYSGAMWAANSAAVSPSADTKDRKIHFTPANLHSHIHRSLDAPFTAQTLKRIFADPKYFTHHPPLPASPYFADEGAANHLRLCSSYHKPGVEVFVYGREGFFFIQNTLKFCPRQTRTAAQIIAHNHQLSEAQTIIAPQNPKLIDAGVFHNDVVCTADQNLIFYYEHAFLNTPQVIKTIEKKLPPAALIKIKTRNKDLSLKEVVSSYLFNSQLLPLNNSEWMLLAPAECKQSPAVQDYLNEITAKTPIKKVHFISARHSMKNGGGPACLRLKVVLTAKEAKALHSGVLLTPALYQKLKQWIKKHYRDRLQPKDLLDPLLITETQTALDELSRILKLPGLYSFQKL